MKEVSYAIQTLTVEKAEYEERMKLLHCNQYRYKRFKKRVNELNNAIEILKRHVSTQK
ncbi:hypothetical protein [Bacillus sp. NPDC094106]|uniref:hypothetical protein n=1 Tax=Bacillus sp. NPDC094106 TaxID=3363949 RepID=UPI0037F7E070